jgi:hypothetical protein
MANRLHRLRFDVASHGILSTPPLRMPEAPLAIVSMVCRRDLWMYLAAVKSLYSALGEGSVTAIDDGSLGAAGHELLRAHIPDIRIVPIREIDTGRCPRGGTWERLVLIMDYTRDRFVIQMDCDTLARGPLPEVTACYRANTSFGLGTKVGKDVAPVARISEWARSVRGSDITLQAERRLCDLEGAGCLKYIRGSSGFAGFARGCFSRQSLETLSTQMRAFVGERWDEWGSEQVASNFTVANAPGACVLPHPDYACFYPDQPIDFSRSKFLHFIGGHRYRQGRYAADVGALVGRLRAGTAS